MRVGVKRSAFVAAACLLWLTGCETTSPKLGEIFGSKTPDSTPNEPADPAVTGSITEPAPANPSAPAASEMLGRDPYDDLNLGKQNFRQANYGLAERYFRRAVEMGPRDAEAWLGLAASYDRLRRFDLADRAYEQLIRIAGATPEILNNQGYSYLLRGDFRRAREILSAAQAKDPTSPYIKNNLDLLEESVRTRKAVR